MRSLLIAAVIAFSLSAFGTARADTIPNDVLQKIRNAPTYDTLTIPQGRDYYAPKIFKVRNLTITPSSRLIFFQIPDPNEEIPFPHHVPFPSSNDHTFVLIVRNLYVQIPTPAERSGGLVITDQAWAKPGTSCSPRPDGANGGVGHDDGYPGGAGVPGVSYRKKRQNVFYVIVNNIVTNGGIPTSSRFFEIQGGGVAGTPGGDGCEGGKGGDGTDRGPFSGPGDSGKPGAGGAGGAGQDGQDGVFVKIFVRPEHEHEAGFIIVSNKGGAGGAGGAGAHCGPTGRAGSGNGWGGGGRGIDCDPPFVAPHGADGAFGQTGAVTKTVGDFSAIMPAAQFLRNYVTIPPAPAKSATPKRAKRKT